MLVGCICSAEFNMSELEALFFGGQFPEDTSISGRWLGGQRRAAPKALSHSLTHVQSAVTHTDINSCKRTHRHAHIHTSAVRQSPPCLTTTEGGGGSWAEEELKGTERYTISKWMD